MELKNKEINYGRAEFESLPLKLIMESVRIYLISVVSISTSVYDRMIGIAKYSLLGLKRPRNTE